MATNNPALNEFLEALAPKLHLGDRFIRVTADDQFGHSSATIRFVNLPVSVVERREGGGAEAENNRATYMARPAKDGKVQVEEIGTVFYKHASLRKKTATPEKAAKHLADHLNDIAENVPPRFTHTKV
jgi:hypothetical protein